MFWHIKHRPIVQAGQNKTPNWRWRQSGRSCGEPQTGSPSTRKHRQSHNRTTKATLPDVRPGKASGPDRMVKLKLPPNITLSRSGLLYERGHSSSLRSYPVSILVHPVTGLHVASVHSMATRHGPVSQSARKGGSRIMPESASTATPQPLCRCQGAIRWQGGRVGTANNRGQNGEDWKRTCRVLETIFVALQDRIPEALSQSTPNRVSGSAKITISPSAHRSYPRRQLGRAAALHKSKKSPIKPLPENLYEKIKSAT